VENRKGVYEIWNVMSTPSGVRGRAPTENEFGYSTAVSIVVVAIMLMILGCVFYIRKLNRKISYCKQIARRYSCRKANWPWQVAWSIV